MVQYYLWAPARAGAIVLLEDVQRMGGPKAKATPSVSDLCERQDRM